jgi:hypothetical protein
MSFAVCESELRLVRALLLVGQFAFQLSSLQAGQ